MGLTLWAMGLVLGTQLIASPVFAADLDAIRARGHLVIGVREGWRPLSFRTDEGDLAGLEVDLARELATEIFGDPEAVVLRVVSNRDRLAAVTDHRVDMAIAGLTVTAGRQRLVAFSPPYYLDGTAILVRDPAFQRLADVQNRRLGVLQGASAVAVVRHLLPRALLSPVVSYQEALTRLGGGHLDGFAGDASVLVGWQQDHSGYHLLPPVLSADPLAIALPKGTQYSDLRQLVGQTVVDWHAQGWLAERTAAWGLP